MAKKKILELNLEISGKPKDSNYPDGGVAAHKADGTKIKVTGKKNPTYSIPSDRKQVKIIPTLLYTHKKNPNCITFVIGGVEYTYCW
jgi:hypothetical protein